MYDEINPLHGYSGVHREENSGTIIPVTPPFTDVDGATRLVGLAARHCVEDDDGTYYARLSCTNERSNVKATHVPPVRIILSAMHLNIEQPHSARLSSISHGIPATCS